MKLLMMCTFVVATVVCSAKRSVVGDGTRPSNQTSVPGGSNGISNQKGTEKSRVAGSVRQRGPSDVISTCCNGSPGQNDMTSAGKNTGQLSQAGIPSIAITPTKPSPKLSLYNGTCYFRILGIANVNEFQVVLGFNQPIDSLSIENFSVLFARHYKVFKLSNTVPITTDSLEVQYTAGYYPHKKPIRGQCHMYNKIRRPAKQRRASP